MIRKTLAEIDAYEKRRAEVVRTYQFAQTEETYEELIRYANTEDPDSLISLAKENGADITEEEAWLLIEAYQTKGNAY